MVWVGRDLTDHLVPTSCQEQGHLPPAQVFKGRSDGWDPRRHSTAPSAWSKPPREPVMPQPVAAELPQFPPLPGRGTPAAETSQLRRHAELREPSLASPPTGEGTESGNDSLRRDVMLEDNSLFQPNLHRRPRHGGDHAEQLAPLSPSPQQAWCCWAGGGTWWSQRSFPTYDSMILWSHLPSRLEEKRSRWGSSISPGAWSNHHHGCLGWTEAPRPCPHGASSFPVFLSPL